MLRDHITLPSWKAVSLMAVLCLVFAGTAEVGAVQGITGVQAAYDNQTSTNDNYSAIGGGSAGFPNTTTYNMSFNNGSQNNLNITGFEVGGNTYQYIQLSDRINIERVDNAVITGRHHIILYEEVLVGNPNIQIKASYVPTMEQSLRSANVNRGADNVFCNTGDGNGNNNNVERIDYIFADGYPLHDNINLRGFLVMDRGGNDRFKIAAITSVTNGVPATFSTPVSVVEGDWGFSGINIDTVVLRGYTEGGDPQHPSADVGLQPLDGVFLAWMEFGLVTNNVIYGYSLVANDVPVGANWAVVTNQTYFPRDSNSGSTGGGLDLMSGGAMFFDSTLDAHAGNFVWDDYNGNGLQDAGEPGISNVLVRLYDSKTNLASVIRTLPNGTFDIRGLAPDTYFMEFVLPTNGYSFSPANVGTNITIDSNAATNNGRTAAFALVQGGTNFTIDAGMHRPSTDLAVTKSVNNSNPNEGDTIAYTIVVTNKGAYTANLIQLTDLIPAGLTYVGSSPSRGTYTSSNGVWNIGTLTNGYSVSMVVTAAVAVGSGGNTITNTAAITMMDRPDTNLLNNTASAALIVKLADIAVSKSVDVPMPLENDPIQYIVTVSNLGPDIATSVVISDPIPAGLTYSSHNVSGGGSYASGTGLWTFGGPLGVGASENLWLTLTVNPGTAGSTITNVASASHADQADHNSGNNTGKSAIVVSAADLKVTKTVNNAAPNEGGTVVYTIAVTNLGPTATSGVTLQDPLAAGITYVTNTISHGSFNSGSKVWTIGSLSVGSGAQMTITCTVDAGTTGTQITNVSSITGSTLPDPNSTNNSASAVVSVSGMTVNKKSSVATYAQPGSNITYTIAVTNLGPGIQTGIKISDPVPAGTTFVSNSVQVSVMSTAVVSSVRDVFGARAYTNNDGTVNWANSWQEVGESDGPLTGGALVTIGSEGLVSANKGLYRSVNLAGASAANFSFYYRELPDLDTANVRDEFSAVTYTNNNGSKQWKTGWAETGESDGAAAGGARVEAGYGLVSSNRWLTRSVDLSEAESAVLSFALPGIGGLETNNVRDEFSSASWANNNGTELWAGDWVEINESDGAGSGDTLITGGYLRTRDNDGGGEGVRRQVNMLGFTNVILSLQYQRVGLDDANDYTALSVSSNGGTSWVELDRYAGPNNDAGMVSANYNITAYASANTQIRLLTSSNMGNNDSVYFDNVDIKGTKPLMEADDAMFVQVSSNGTSWVTLLSRTNAFNAVTTNYNIMSYASANTAVRFGVTNYTGKDEKFRFDNVDVTYETQNLETNDIMYVEVSSNAVSWVTLMSRADDFVGTYYTNFDISAYASTNTSVRFRTSGYADTNESLFFENVEISFSTQPQPGVSGNPPNVATNYTLYAGESMLVTYDVKVNDPIYQTFITNTVSVTSTQQSVPVVKKVIDPVINVDLAVAKTVNNPSPDEGNTIIYTVALTNKGPLNATGVVLTDLLPAGLTYVTNSRTAGSYNSGSGAWTVGSLAVSNGAVLTLSATVNAGKAGSTITNTASITALDQVDPVLTNNTASAVVVVKGVDVGVTKTVNVPIPYEAQNIVYTMIATNAGPSTATGISLKDQLPGGVTYQSHVASTGTYTSATGIWTNFTLAANATAQLQITAKVNAGTAGSSITNRIGILSVTEKDNNPANSNATAVITPISTPLKISKASNVSGYAKPGDVVTYTMVVSNQSGTVKTGVNLTDILPTNTTYVVSSSSVVGPYVKVDTYLDEFGVRVYTNSNGTLDWVTKTWEESEANGPIAGNLQVIRDASRDTYSMQYAGDNAWFRRMANTAGYTNLMLSFNYRRDNLLAGHSVSVQVSSNGFTGTWNNLATIAGPATDANYSLTNYNITSYASTNMAVRFYNNGTGMGAGNILWLDDVKIQLTKRTTNSLAGGAPPNIATNYTLYPGEKLTATFQLALNVPYPMTQLVNTASAVCDGFAPLSASVTDRVVKASIGDFVWMDSNTNGLQDVGEPGVGGVTVQLYGASSNLLYSTVTATNGSYVFNGWTGGTYQIRYVIPSNYAFTAKDVGGNDAIDSDADVVTGWTAAFAVTNGATVTSVDAGLTFPPAKIGDFVWFDSNADGIQDGGETGVVGVTVQLYNSSSNLLRTAVTGGSGYLFTNVSAGAYFVKYTLPATYAFSPKDMGGDDAKDSDADLATGKTPLFVLNGTDNLTIDAGMYIAAAVGGTVWYDPNSDGIQNAGETTGVQNVQVVLYNSSSNFIALTSTDSNGNYSFDGLLPGSYFLDFATYGDYLFSPQDQGGNDATDSDPNVSSGRTAAFTLTAGVNDQTRDAGMYIPTSTVGDRVWYDTNGDGVQDGGEAGVTNVTVKLYNSSLVLQGTTATDVSGNYSFAGLLPGDYIVEVVKPGGYVFSPKDVGMNDTVDSDVDTASGRTGSFNIGAGTVDSSRDAGIYIPAVIGNFVWYDSNTNGVQDGGEAGISNVTVRLYNSASNLLATTQTDGSGLYSFADVAPGSYFVEYGLPTYHVFSPKDQGGNDALDSDADVVTGRTAIFAITHNTVDNTRDAGMYIPPSTIGDFVWYDANLDGIQDGGEAGVTNVTVKLYDADTNLISIAVTGGAGGYSFTNIVPGSYFVEFVLPTNYLFTLQAQGGDDTLDSDVDPVTGFTELFWVGAGVNEIDWDCGVYVPSELGDRLWFDLDHDGIQDAGEAGFGGATVRLYGSATNLLDTATTDGVGGYSFTNLAAGNYYVEFVLPTNYTFSPKDTGGNDNLDSDANAGSGFTDVISLGSGVAVTNVDAGIYVEFSGIGNYVWFDANTNGVQDGGESAFSNVTVRLYSVSTQLVAQAVTAADGTYAFTNILFGSYFVHFLRPAGYAYTQPDQGGDDNLDSDANQGSGRSPVFYVAPGETNSTIDCGFTLPVSGLTATKTSDAVGYLEPGDTITYTISISNTGTTEQTGITVTDPLPAGVTYVPGSTVVVAPGTVTNTIRDQFDAVSYGNNDGTANWLNDWQEEGDDGSISAGDVYVGTGLDTYVLHTKDDLNGVWRMADLSGAMSATLSYSWARYGMDAGEYYNVYVSSDGGGGWSQVAQYMGDSGTDGSLTATNIDISFWIATNTAIRFYTDNGGLRDNEGIQWDDVTITYTTTGIATNAGGAPPALASGYSLSPGGSMTVTFAATVTDPTTITQIVNTATVVSDLSIPILCVVTDNVQYTDLAVEKSINTDKPGTNEVVWYTIVLTNNGPYRAAGIEVKDTWPSEVVFSSFSASQGTYESSPHIWSVGALEVNASATLVLTGLVANVSEQTTIQNFVEITAIDRLDIYEPNDTNASKATTLVELKRFESFRRGQQVVLEWETATEAYTAGFYIERQAEEGDYIQITSDLLRVKPNQMFGAVYRFIDGGASPGQDYTYRLVEIELTGKRREYGPFELNASVPLKARKGEWVDKAGGFSVGSEESERKKTRIDARKAEVDERGRLLDKRLKKSRSVREAVLKKDRDNKSRKQK